MSIFDSTTQINDLLLLFHQKILFWNDMNHLMKWWSIKCYKCSVLSVFELYCFKFRHCIECFEWLMFICILYRERTSISSFLLEILIKDKENLDQKTQLTYNCCIMCLSLKRVVLDKLALTFELWMSLAVIDALVLSDEVLERSYYTRGH